MSKTISLIAAIGKNGELGKDNDLLWHLPIDFKWFIQKTKNKPVIMGRKTMQSLGKPLKNRENIVLSRSDEFMIDGFQRVSDWESAFELTNKFDSDEIMIIGGAEIYKQSIQFADRLYLTFVDAEFHDADSFFPSVNLENWSLEFSEKHDLDSDHNYAFEFNIFNKRV